MNTYPNGISEERIEQFVQRYTELVNRDDLAHLSYDTRKKKAKRVLNEEYPQISKLVRMRGKRAFSGVEIATEEDVLAQEIIGKLGSLGRRLRPQNGAHKKDSLRGANGEWRNAYELLSGWLLNNDVASFPMLAFASGYTQSAFYDPLEELRKEGWVIHTEKQHGTTFHVVHERPAISKEQAEIRELGNRIEALKARLEELSAK